MTKPPRTDEVSKLAQIRELLQSAHWAARELAEDAPLGLERLLDSIHSARKAAESASTAGCLVTAARARAA